MNGFDVSVAKGLLRGMMEHRYPVVGGKDFAGVVESVGEAVTDLAPGDEVAGVTPYEPVLSRGAFAELVVVPATGFIQRRPPDLDLGASGLGGVGSDHRARLGRRGRGVRWRRGARRGGSRGRRRLRRPTRGPARCHRGGDRPSRGRRLAPRLGAGEVVDYSGDVAAAVRAAHPKGVDALIVAVNLGDAFEPTATLVKDGGRLASTSAARRTSRSPRGGSWGRT